MKVLFFVFGRILGDGMRVDVDGEFFSEDRRNENIISKARVFGYVRFFEDFPVNTIQNGSVRFFNMASRL